MSLAYDRLRQIRKIIMRSFFEEDNMKEAHKTPQIVLKVLFNEPSYCTDTVPPLTFCHAVRKTYAASNTFSSDQCTFRYDFTQKLTYLIGAL